MIILIARDADLLGKDFVKTLKSVVEFRVPLPKERYYFSSSLLKSLLKNTLELLYGKKLFLLKFLYLIVSILKY